MRSFISTLSNLLQLEKLSDPQDCQSNMFDSSKREMHIPLYQRPYSWETSRVETLISDVERGAKFLGIVILDETDQHYNIIDGQQRISTCYMILAILFNLLARTPMEQASVKKALLFNDHLLLVNKSLTTSGADFLKMDGQTNIFELNIGQPKTEDRYYQKEYYQEILQFIKESLIQKTCVNSIKTDFPDRKIADIEYLELTDQNNSYTKVKSILKNLLRSEFLILIRDKDQGYHQNVEQIFLDINEKSKKLDSADIFKGHCFENYEEDYYSILETRWSNIIACSRYFEKNLNIKGLSNFIYYFLLVAKDNSLPEDLSPKGKHILQDKSGDYTDSLLKEMGDYGQAVEALSENINRVDYYFGDLCDDAEAHKNDIADMFILKKTISGILKSSSRANYQKLPFLYYIYLLTQNERVRNSITYEEFRQIIANYYVYSVLFQENPSDKGKKLIDTELKNAFLKDKSEETVRALILRARELRNEQIKLYRIPFEQKGFEKQAFIYSIIDFYNCQTNSLKGIYSRDDAEKHNQEHFIVPNSHKKGIDFVIELNLSISGTSDSQLQKANHPSIKVLLEDERSKERKKHLINYIIIPESLNGSLKSNDIISKIQSIKNWYSGLGKPLPKHIDVIIKFIEDMSEYKQLCDLRKALSEELIAELKEKKTYSEICKVEKRYAEEKQSSVMTAYIQFLEAFFNEESEKILNEKLNKLFHNAFSQQRI